MLHPPDPISFMVSEDGVCVTDAVQHTAAMLHCARTHAPYAAAVAAL